MKNYGIINQDGKLCIFDQDKHKTVLRVSVFDELVEWMRHHPGHYKFIDFDVDMKLEY